MQLQFTLLHEKKTSKRIRYQNVLPLEPKKKTLTIAKKKSKLGLSTVHLMGCQGNRIAF